MVRLRMHVEDRQRHWPGQHYLIRLRAPDDYTAQRSYSVASDDDDPLVEFLVEKLPGGEVSEFLADVAEVGDVLEMRGPIGRWFVWDTRTPALCLVGGTGVVPAVAMTRAARHVGRKDLIRVVAVGRSHRDLPYADELARAGATLAYTRVADGPRPPGPPTPAEVAPLLAGVEVAYVCGSSRFAELGEALLECGFPMDASGSSSSAPRAEVVPGFRDGLAPQAALRRPSSTTVSAYPEPQVRGAVALEHPDPFQLALPNAQRAEQWPAATEQDRHEVDLQLVQDAGLESTRGDAAPWTRTSLSPAASRAGRTRPRRRCRSGPGASRRSSRGGDRG